MNLNGLWGLAIANRDAAKPDSFPEQILVPFPIESALSGVMKIPGEDQRIWYRRNFSIPKKWIGERILLHFGAVDFEATVWVNGKKVGDHRGGYDGFTFDITDAKPLPGPNELLVSAWDPTDAGTHDVSFYCDDIEGTVADLRSRNVPFTSPIEDRGYGRVTHFTAPGGIRIQLYQPRYTKGTSRSRPKPPAKRASPARKAKRPAARKRRR